MAKWASEFDRQALGIGQTLSGIVKIAAAPGVAVEQLGLLPANFRPVFTSDHYFVQKPAVKNGLGAFITNRPVGFESSELI